MRIRFWGVRGSIPAPAPNTTVVGGNTPCVQVTGEDGTELILDAGSGIRELHASDVGHAKRIHILLTHLHLDHIHGLLFFRPLFDPEAEVTVWGPPGRASLRSSSDLRCGGRRETTRMSPTSRVNWRRTACRSRAPACVTNMARRSP